jgi:DNA-binding response OmpR family regulator
MKRKTVIVLEDDEENNKAINMVLENISDENVEYNPYPASGVLDAVGHLVLLGGKCDLLITDYNLDGHTSEDFIKTFQKVCGNKILMISASLEGKEVARNLDIDYLDKPANLKDIVKSIKKLDK